MRQLTFVLATSIVWSLLFASSLSAQRIEYGQAAYYSNNMQGKKTSSGETYDKALLTAAHRTLPIGTVVLITRVDNSKSVEVKINDCGPFTNGRIIDLSRAAAEKIGLIKDGVTVVKLEVVKLGTGKPACGGSVPKPAPAATTPPAPKQEKAAATAPKPAEKTELLPATQGTFKAEALRSIDTGFAVQVASYTNGANAQAKAMELEAKKFNNVLLNVNGSRIRVVLGPFDTREKANAYLASIKKSHKMSGFVMDLSK